MSKLPKIGFRGTAANPTIFIYPEDRPMTNDQFRALRESLEMNRAEFAAAIGIAPNTETAYETGRSRIPLYIGLACAALKAGLAPIGGKDR